MKRTTELFHALTMIIVPPVVIWISVSLAIYKQYGTFHPDWNQIYASKMK